MTSQGVGNPFAPGETMMGYQACELHGKVYIGVEEQLKDSAGNCYEEKLTNLHAEDEIYFRYVESAKDWTKVRLITAGSGKVTVWMNGKIAGSITVEGKTRITKLTEAEIGMPAGRYEVVLKVDAAEGLEIFEVTVE